MRLISRDIHDSTFVHTDGSSSVTAGRLESPFQDS